MVRDRRFARWALAGAALLSALWLGPAALGARQCGGPQHVACAAAEYCHRAGPACHASDGVGVCEVRPLFCQDVWVGVCGCDGRTYGNLCLAERAGASVAHPGKCVERS